MKIGQYLAKNWTIVGCLVFLDHSVLWDRDQCVKFWDKKVRFQGHGGITYAGTHCTGVGVQYSTSHVELGFLVLSDIEDILCLECIHVVDLVSVRALSQMYGCDTASSI